ncbi:ABC transporter substrate-binding protein [Massilia sp. ZL223]|uniref:ABC transporter substrate-binding protein n=1 Tax=Massilia sp. ZL223 TaxID=2824904 RepID=UPI001B82AF87|nr:ABC transporter substrate-binding protein [Massilia sp. ZL223]MBQ5961731.1 ABC transporter substrate-binding protein [Massilia sp. ZL223]
MMPDEPATLHALRRRQVLKSALAAAAPLMLPAPVQAAAAKPLIVGGLPVTCNLTLPIACQARTRVNEQRGAGPSPFAYAKFSGWPEVKESLMTGRIQAAYMLAPLVMDLVDSRIPLKIVSLGHRSGAVIMVRTDSPARTFRDLRGKSIAIPSRFAVDFLFLRKMLARAGMTPKDITLIEMAPPDMPAALYARAVDAYCTGEPFGAAAQRAGYARPLAMTRDEWRNYICCVLTVREDLIRTDRPLVQDLVNHIQSAGDWLDKGPANRDKAAHIAASRTYFGQDPKIIKFVMDNPEDRVTYGDLRMIRAEFDELMQLSVEAGTLKRPVAYERYVDESFYRNIKPVPIPL